MCVSAGTITFELNDLRPRLSGVLVDLDLYEDTFEGLAGKQELRHFAGTADRVVATAENKYSTEKQI